MHPLSQAFSGRLEFVRAGDALEALDCPAVPTGLLVENGADGALAEVGLLDDAVEG
jgi:hypothetical protein